MSSSPPNETWKDETLAKVIEITENQEALARVLWYLTEEDKKYKESGQVSPTWRTLKSVLRKDTAFKLFVDQIAETTKQPDIDPNFRETMRLTNEEIKGQSKKDTLDESKVEEDVLTALGPQDHNIDSNSDWLTRACSLIQPCWIPRDLSMRAKQCDIHASTRHLYPVAVPIEPVLGSQMLYTVAYRARSFE